MMLPSAPIPAFADFGRRMLVSRDIDPVYPVLEKLIDDLGLEEPRADWLTVLYLAYYEPSSAVTAFLIHPEPDRQTILNDERALKLPTGIERRGLRTAENMRRHLASWLSVFDGESFFTLVRELFMTPSQHTGAEFYNEGVLSEYFRTIEFNGRWAAYKGCEVMHKVRGYPNKAADAGHENSTGPREGLKLFFPEVRGNYPRAIERLDYQTQLLLEVCGQHGLKLDVDELETLLCDFKSLTRARYYVGHDIDLMLEGVLAAPEQTRELLLEARTALPVPYLGELHGWTGRDRQLMHAYADSGDIGDRGQKAAERGRYTPVVHH